MNFKSVQTAIETTLIFITLFLIAILSYVLTNAILDYFDNRVNSVSIEQQAIERGYALHCPKNGEFAWKGECND